MSYVKVPSLIRYGSKSLEDNYVGTGTDSGKYLWHVPTSGNNATYIKSTTKPTWTLTSSSSGPGSFVSTGEYGGEMCFQSGNGYLIYYLPSKSRWMMVKDGSYYGYIPRAAAEADLQTDGTYVYTYSGDIWWEATSFNPTPWNGVTAGTFRFALADYVGRYTELASYNVNHVLTGGVTTPFAKPTSGNGPVGVYDDGTYVGFPVWRFSSGGYHYVTKYGNNQWFNLRQYTVSSLGTHVLTSTWTGWVAKEILAGAPTDAPTGFYAVLTMPTVGTNFSLSWFHFVPSDPDDPDSPGTIETATSWVDDEGNTHNQPAITVSWQGYKDASTTYLPKALHEAVIGIGEAAIWR